MQPIPNLNHRRNLLLLICSSIGILGLVVRGLYLWVISIPAFDARNGASIASNVLEGLAMLFCAGLVVPVVVYTIKELKGKAISPANIQPLKLWQVIGLGAGWLMILIIGSVLASILKFGWALAAPLFLLGISLPILSFIWIGTGGLPSGSRRRLFTVFSFGMVGGTLAAALLEYLVVGIAVLVIGVVAVSNPAVHTFLEEIKNQVVNANAGNIQSLMTVLAPFLSNPLILLSILLFAAVITPMIEEAVKPAILWFIGKRLRSPAEGFFLGALCGAGFAMLEGLLAASNATQMWGLGLAGRAAASLMHITSSGILGWGIASAQLEKNHRRLATTYLLSISIHGLWNGSAILAVYGALRVMLQNAQIDIAGVLLVTAGLGMLFLELVVMLTALPLINRQLRHSSVLVHEPVQSDIIAPPVTSNPRQPNGLDS